MNNWLRKQKFKARYLFKLTTEKYPGLFISIQRWRYQNKSFLSQIVSDNTDLLIEGFPRSANSFAVAAFRQAQKDRSLIIGNHTHSLAQIIQGIRYEKPVILLIRSPHNTIASLKALNMQVHSGDPEILDIMDPKWEIKYYMLLYKSLFKHRESLIVAPFEKTVKDFGEIINRCNEKFNTNFIPFENKEETTAAIFNKGGYHLSPSKERENYKKIIRSKLNTKYYRELLDQAECVYNEWIDYYLSLYPEDRKLFNKSF